MLYDYTVLSLKPQRMPKVAPGLQETVARSFGHGKLLGCFACEIGELNRIAVLTAYEDAAALQQDRSMLLTGNDPYGIGEHLASVERASYKPLSFVDPIQVGSFGAFYEIRQYEIAAGGLQQTSDAWAKVIQRRLEISPMVVVMASLDVTPQRFVHIWPHADFSERAKIRGQAAKEGIWPPPGGTEHFVKLKSEIFLPTAFSPLK